MRVFRWPIFILLFVMVGCASSQRSVELVGSKPQFVRIVDLEGGRNLLSSYSGQPVAIAFWASWCSRSRAMISELYTLLNSETAFSSPLILLISVDKDQDSKEVLEIAKRYSHPSMKYFFSGNDVDDEAALQFRVDEIPHYVLLDAKGVVAGDTLDYEQFELWIKFRS